MTLPVFHALPIPEVADRLQTNLTTGLTSSQAAQHIRDQGYNELTEKPKPGFLKLLLAQFNNFLVIILILAALVSLLLGETIEAGAIFVIVLINAVVGVIQESKAEQALDALKKMAAPLAQVIRDGQQKTIPALELVPGDLVLIEAGNYVPADLRLIESHNLKVEEASLTGESMPVEKEAQIVLDAELSLGDRRNSAFMSTMITYGRAKGLVTATGMQTQIGLIAEMIQSYEVEETPLQHKLDQLAKVFGMICLAVCGIIFIYGLVRDTQLALIVKEGLAAYFTHEKSQILELFMIAVSLAIAAVPEGLPAVVTICLALGMQKMIKRHALIRKLPAVETLGCTTVICSDKTGTLTQNEMTIVRVWANHKDIEVSGQGYHPLGDFRINNEPIDPQADPDLSFMLLAGLLCNDAKLNRLNDAQKEIDWHMIGDPTEGAMVVLAGKAGLWRDSAEQAFPRIMELPFDSERKRMTTIHANQKDQKLLRSPLLSAPFMALVKGAADLILDHCTHFQEQGQAMALTPAKKLEILGHNTAMAHQALRVLGIAYKPLHAKPVAPDHTVIEQGLTFIGLFGMIDPARPEAKIAIKAAQTAGIKCVMVTGDYKDTAVAIAKEIGLLSAQGRVFSGAELEKMSDTELAEVIDRTDAFCRVSPQHKTRIVEAFKARGHVVAMTGDGVNDAPALKRANIGIAMGITGTDVSKQTADMVLTDDNFASIVSAIEEGRIIYANIRKFVFF
ncbi:MAG: HAD family hydrolase, partial [Desulfobacteraceae bacterium]